MAGIIAVGSLTGTLSSTKQPLSGSLSLDSRNPLRGSLSKNIIAFEYTGETEVESKPFEDQILQTENRTLTTNILVKKIPVYETSNQSGGTTVYIGG